MYIYAIIANNKHLSMYFYGEAWRKNLLLVPAGILLFPS